MHPFAPRPIRFLGVREHAGWRLKSYSLVYGEAPLDAPRFRVGLELALAALPAPAARPGRPGVGFVILHQGRGADYVELFWWDRENELPLRLVVRDQAPEAAWRPATEAESVCVWDLEVVWFEREAYVATVLASGGGSVAVESYLARRLTAPAANARQDQRRRGERVTASAR